MKSQYGFTLMTISEFESWIVQQKVTRRITVIQEHHTWSPCYKQFNGSNHLQLQKNMRDYHVNSAGYADIAQNFTVFPDGMICTGRSMNVAPPVVVEQTRTASVLRTLATSTLVATR